MSDVSKNDNVAENLDHVDFGDLSELLEEFFPQTEENIGADHAASEAAVPLGEPEDEQGADEVREAAMANAIAEALADSLFSVPEEDAEPENPRPEPASSVILETVSEPVIPAVKTRIAPEDAATEPPVEEIPDEPPSDPEPESEPKPTGAVRKSGKKAKNKPKTRANTPKRDQETAHNPGTDHVKISRSRVSITPKEYFASIFSGVLERQQEALPEVGVNLRTHEKKLAAITGMSRLLNPVRYIIILLMFLCLAGRKYSWMTLGFMKGIHGTHVALVLTIVALILCWQSLWRGLRDMAYMRFSHESYLLIATMLSMFEAIYTKNERTLLPLLTMSWCVCGIAELMDSQANLRFLRALITGRNRVGIRIGRNKWDNYEVIGKAPAGTNGFVRKQAEPDLWHSVGSWFLLPLIVVCFVVSAYLGGKTQGNYFTILVTLLDIGMPVSMMLCCSRPYYLLSQVLSGKGVVSGWAGIKSLSGKKAVMIRDDDLFPKGTIGHKGVKVFGRYTASQLVSYGASLVIQADIGLTDVFVRLLRETDGQMLDVSQLQIQESGVEGRIHRSRVQVGTYHYMQLMGISVPGKGSSNGIYIAINGQFAGIFAMKYGLRSGSISAFRRFSRERGLTPLIATRNFTVNPAFIQKSYKVSINQLSCPKTEVRRALSQNVFMEKGTTCGYVLRDGINSYSRTVGGARRIYRMGLVFTLCSLLLTLYLTVDTIMAIYAGRAVIEVTRLLLMQFWLFVAVEIGARLAVRK